MNRRSFLWGSFSLSVGAVSGCLGSGADAPDPVDLSGEKFDDQGGMAIGDHGGPNGQVFYAENSPDGHENPAWFHTLVFGLFPYHLDRLDRGWEAEAVYVTDYSVVDWTPEEDSPQLPSPTAPDTFADGTEVTYVAESSAVGGMGPALVPFSDGDDAEDFADEYGGRTVGFGEITREFLTDIRANSGMDSM
jgi:nitrous oxide reductase accessory protein NosL